MKSTYKKLGLDGFLENLENGKYKSIGGARKAIGKSSWTGKEKEKAAEAAEKQLGSGEKPVKKAKGKPGRKPGRKPKAEAKVAAPKAEKVKALKPSVTGAIVSTKEVRLLQELGIISNKIGTISQAIVALERAKQLSSKLDISEGIQVSKEVLTTSVKELQKLTGSARTRGNGKVEEATSASSLTPDAAEAVVEAS